MKIITIIGARPQFIKAAVVSRYILENCSSAIKEIIVHTGQHYDANMSDIFFEQMDIPKPDYFLNVNGLSHGAMTGQMLEKIEAVLINEKPDWVLVYGDTNSTLAGALAAKKLHIKLAHVEAGLRSFNMAMPEEINRILTDRISDILFCPTDQAIANLKSEGYQNISATILKSGDVMQDAALYYSTKSQKPELSVSENFVLCTIHRAENTDNLDRLKSIFAALSEISKLHQVVLPLHPRTKNIVIKNNIIIDNENIKIIDPVGYLEMIHLLKNCQFVMTDSGGLQKEAFFFGKLCLTLRDETEWVELVENSFNIIVGSNREKIINGAEKLQTLNPKFEKNLYGQGKTGENIVNAIINYKN
ncbi:MAG: UDP-N-acetylglucosamine 2-epimerase (non-hydrolyzing) [Bacteroidales bacterium]|nr:UDP-N-acetylglucosamine 2-epimerase (non-hydrolyzing) [Bacteroidales bacterium]